MSKMAEMTQTIEELRTAAASINATADWLYQQFSSDDNSTQEPAKAPVKRDAKLEDVRVVLAEKSRAGHTAEVRALLKEQAEADIHHREETMNRIKELQDFIAQQKTDITKFNETLVKKLIEKITIFADHFTVEFKSDLTIEIEA